jgi:hypothetical protein
VFLQLENKQFYEPASYNYNPTSKVEARTKLFIKHLVSQKFITVEQSKNLQPLNSYAPYVFAQVKVHKPDMPLRLITTAKFIPYSALAKLVKPLLKELSKSVFTCSNSIEFVSKLQSHPPPPGIVHFKADVVGLFPSISQELMLLDLKEACEANPNLLTHFNLSAECVLEIVQFIFQNTYVRFENKFFLSERGDPNWGRAVEFFDRHFSQQI